MIIELNCVSIFVFVGIIKGGYEWIKYLNLIILVYMLMITCRNFLFNIFWISMDSTYYELVPENVMYSVSRYKIVCMLLYYYDADIVSIS